MTETPTEAQAAPPCQDGDLTSVAQHALQCAWSWEPTARLIGNARAGDLADIFERFLELQKLAHIVAHDPKQPRFRREFAGTLVRPATFFQTPTETL